jgi:DNA-binding transcriptional LysR family regulator
MRLEQLEYVTAVTEHGSLRRAGERLHVSLPALSEAIGKLERELGVTLLDRHRSGARISDDGRDLLPHMRDVLGAVERLQEAATGQRRQVRGLRLGTVNTGTSTLLLPTLSALKERPNSFGVEVRHLSQPEIETGLLESTLDVGLVNLLDGDDIHPDLRRTTLVRGHPTVALPTGHPLTAQESISCADLRHEPFVGTREGYLMHRVIRRIFDDDLPQRWHTVDGADMGKHMVAAGLGVMVLPDFTIDDDPTVRAGLVTVRPIRGPIPTIRLTLLQRRSNRPPAELTMLIEALVIRAGQLQPQSTPPDDSHVRGA